MPIGNELLFRPRQHAHASVGMAPNAAKVWGEGFAFATEDGPTHSGDPRTGQAAIAMEFPIMLHRLDNPPNPYLSEHREWLEPPPEVRVEVYEETAKSILSKNDSPDLPFNWSVNPYRGCQHACAYCYARPYHELLGYGAGTDFDTRLIAKRNAPDLLRRALRKPGWRGESINFSGITDCYQPIEACYRITRRCLEVCADLCNPAVVVTKGFLVVRDADVLARLNDRASARVLMSIPFADAETSKLIEPQAPAPARRFEAMRRLHEAGVPVAVLVSPIIPGLNDRDVPRILEQAADCGATSCAFIPLRLPGSVEAVFLKRLREVMPLRARKIINRLREMRGGKLAESRFGHRMRGAGAYWQSIRDLFDISRKRCGLAACSRPEPIPPGAVSGETSGKRSPPSAQLQFDFA